jgi:hypothetical protein
MKKAMMMKEGESFNTLANSYKTWNNKFVRVKEGEGYVSGKFYYGLL